VSLLEQNFATRSPPAAFRSAFGRAANRAAVQEREVKRRRQRQGLDDAVCGFPIRSSSGALAWSRLT
jgi:hypothetical protein